MPALVTAGPYDTPSLEAWRLTAADELEPKPRQHELAGTTTTAPALAFFKKVLFLLVGLVVAALAVCGGGVTPSLTTQRAPSAFFA